MKIKTSKIRSTHLSPSEVQSILLKAFCLELGDGTLPGDCKIKTQRDGRIKIWVKNSLNFALEETEPEVQSSESPELQSWELSESYPDMESITSAGGDHGIKAGDTVRLDYRDGRDSTEIVVDRIGSHDNDLWVDVTHEFFNAAWPRWEAWLLHGHSHLGNVKRITLVKRAGED